MGGLIMFWLWVIVSILAAALIVGREVRKNLEKETKNFPKSRAEDQIIRTNRNQGIK